VHCRGEQGDPTVFGWKGDPGLTENERDMELDREKSVEEEDLGL
jgi:hypothetical protein